MLLEIGLGILALVALLLLVAATRPSTFRIERSTVIAAPTDVIFALLADFRQWVKWSPFEKKDLNMKRSYTGAASGIGSVYSWAGNKDIGEGQMTITESKPYERLGIQLEFFKPWKATNQAEFTLKRVANGVSVTWTMSGQKNFMCKLFSIFMNMDEMIGKDFASGLAELKREAETAVPVAAVSSR